MLRCSPEGRASKHADTSERSTSFEAAARAAAPQDDVVREALASNYPAVLCISRT
jgi:hypothetical protein